LIAGPGWIETNVVETKKPGPRPGLFMFETDDEALRRPLPARASSSVRDGSSPRARTCRPPRP
jgi:hypothetical protein